MISEDLMLAVKCGSHWLDTNHPGWAQKINLDNLQMDSCDYCIIGQAVGDYVYEIQNAAGQPIYCRDAMIWGSEHGFEAPMQTYDDFSSDDCGLKALRQTYDDLDILWTEQVKDRL